jgi:hypothetical protein
MASASARDAVKQFVTYFYRHIREKNGARATRRDATRRDATRRERFCARARSNARRGRGGCVGTARSPRKRAVRDARDD